MWRKWYYWTHRVGQTHTPTFYQLAFRHRTIVKFIISGGTAAFVDLVLIYALTDLFGLWYLLSAILAFLVAFVVSFCMQKFWAFRDTDLSRAHRQLISYLFVGVTNLFLNTFLVYVFVDIIGIWYFFAQIIASGLIALGSFFIYKHLIFSK